MKFDYEILKDAICEKYADVTRKNIIFENVYEFGDYIISPYRELIWSNKFSIKKSDYQLRVNQKEREDKLSKILNEN